MHATPRGEKPSDPYQRDPEVLSLLQDLSRRLDINSAENIRFVRDKVKGLIDSGKMSPPSLGLRGEEFSADLRVLAQQQGWDVRAASLRDISPAQARLLLRKDKARLEEPPDVDTLTAPELSQLISDGIRLNSGMSLFPQTPMRGSPGRRR